MKNYTLVQRLFHKSLLVVKSLIYNGKATFSTQQKKKLPQKILAKGWRDKKYHASTYSEVNEGVENKNHHSTTPRAPLPHRHSEVKSRVTSRHAGSYPREKPEN